MPLACDIVRSRARRFHALHDLLTGVPFLKPSRGETPNLIPLNAQIEGTLVPTWRELTQRDQPLNRAE